MLLQKEDIERIKRLGYDYSYFVANRDGWLQLKNYDGRCVFNDGKKCLIYENRPEGCKFYPTIYDENKNCATLDEDCPHRDKFKISKINGRWGSWLRDMAKLAEAGEIERTERGQVEEPVGP